MSGPVFDGARRSGSCSQHWVNCEDGLRKKIALRRATRSCSGRMINDISPGSHSTNAPTLPEGASQHVAWHCRRWTDTPAWMHQRILSCKRSAADLCEDLIEPKSFLV